MATIKAIEGRSVHQIQSGQVIVDLTSVVKELVENSLDAGANSIDVRFKAQGLEAIEVQDNGAGVAKADFETLGLKHYTSKLSKYDDLASLDTFGFRGEALSSLCALSNLHIITAQDGEAPKGSKLEFAHSGKLDNVLVAATQKGTLVVVESLFHSLPVRRRELEKNIKREYSKVIVQLNAYACVSTGVRFTVSQQATKGKKVVVFSTRNNLTTRENIANVYGTKAISALIPLDLDLEMQPTMLSQVLREAHVGDSASSRQIRVEGHISKPIHGEGRQTPDRQMFFVNSRPCGLPQLAKAFNEVYKSYNMNQSPFVFANFKMDTNAYDVNVSPDKKTIMLHDQQRLLETLKEALVNLFESQDQTIPTQQIQATKLPSYKLPSMIQGHSFDPHSNHSQAKQDPVISTKFTGPSSPAEEQLRLRKHPQALLDSLQSTVASSSINGSVNTPVELIGNFAGRNAEQRHDTTSWPNDDPDVPSKDKRKLARKFARQNLEISISADGSKHSEETAATLSSDSSVVDSSDESDRDESAAAKATKSKSPSINQIDNGISSRSNPAPEKTPSPAPVTLLNQGIMKVGPTKSKLGPLKRRRLITAEDDSSDLKSTGSTQFSSSLLAYAAPGAKLEKSDARPSKMTAFFSRAATSETDQNAKTSAEMSESEVIDEDEESTNANDQSESDEADVNASSNIKRADAGDEDEKHKAAEEARVRRMVELAEGAAHAAPSSQKRINLQRRAGETIHDVVKPFSISILQLQKLHGSLDITQRRRDLTEEQSDDVTKSQVTLEDPEERLSLSISKSDFSRMRVVGQYNLGFILAVRPSRKLDDSKLQSSHDFDELFIIDQHASDEIYNFHRLSATTRLTPQPLVRPHYLQLTAIEEETILDHKDASLAKNGFNIAIDMSGEKPVGERCSLLTLPTSKETIFNVRDLEELLVLLTETPAPSHMSPPLPDVDTSEHLEGVSSHRTLPLEHTKSIVRPTKIRAMLAMRACRSSIMVGKALTQTGMQRVVRHMGEIERPWNCPHGRPTMRHLSRLDKVGGWDEWGAYWKPSDLDRADDPDFMSVDDVRMPGQSQIGSGTLTSDETRMWKRWLATQRGSDADSHYDDHDEGSEDEGYDDEDREASIQATDEED